MSKKMPSWCVLLLLVVGNRAVEAQLPFDLPTGPAAFDPQDRAKTDAFLRDVLRQWDAVALEPNPLVRRDGMAAQQQRIDDVNRQWRGKEIQWKFTTLLPGDPFPLGVYVAIDWPPPTK